MTLAPFPSRSSQCFQLVVVHTVGGCEWEERALPRVLLPLALRLHLLRLTVVLLHELSALLFVHLTCCR